MIIRLYNRYAHNLPKFSTKCYLEWSCVSNFRNVPHVTPNSPTAGAAVATSQLYTQWGGHSKT